MAKCKRTHTQENLSTRAFNHFFPRSGVQNAKSENQKQIKAPVSIAISVADAREMPLESLPSRGSLLLFWGLVFGFWGSFLHFFNVFLNKEFNKHLGGPQVVGLGLRLRRPVEEAKVARRRRRQRRQHKVAQTHGPTTTTTGAEQQHRGAAGRGAIWAFLSYFLRPA